MTEMYTQHYKKLLNKEMSEKKYNEKKGRLKRKHKSLNRTCVILCVFQLTIDFLFDSTCQKLKRRCFLLQILSLTIIEFN